MRKPTLATRTVTHKRLIRRGHLIKIKYTWRYAKHRSHRAPSADTSTDHIEISFDPANAPFIPISTTGYRSFFIGTRRLRSLGGPVVFVVAQLEQAARDPAWVKAANKARQLDLFI